MVRRLSPGTYWVVFDAPVATLRVMGMDVCKIPRCVCDNGSDTRAWEIGVHLLVSLFPDDHSCTLSLGHWQASSEETEDYHHVVFLGATNTEQGNTIKKEIAARGLRKNAMKIHVGCGGNEGKEVTVTCKVFK